MTTGQPVDDGRDAPPDPARGAAARPGRRSWSTNPFVWGALAGLAAIPLLRPLLRRVPAPLPVIARIPAYRLTNQSGESFGSRDLAGRVYVASFFCTRCPSRGPRATRAMRRLQDRFAQLGVDIELVSISVDPDRDQPPRLLAHGREHGADFSRWTFLTARDGGAIRKLVSEGFEPHLGPPDQTDLAQRDRLAIVDRAGRLRGVFDSDDHGLSEVVHRAVHVMLEKPD